MVKVKLSASMIKEEYNNSDNYEELLKDEAVYAKYTLKENFEFEGAIFIGENTSNIPDWLPFLRLGTDETISDLNNKSTRAVLFIKVNDEVIAFTHGHGRYLLNDDVLIKDFGLKVVLNSIEPNSLKSIDLTQIGESNFQTRSQTNRGSRINNFNFDVSSDLLRAVTGKPINEDLGKKISGKDTLHFTYEFENDFFDFADICNELITSYYSEEYQNYFSWVDNLRVVNDNGLKNELNERLIEEINRQNTESVSLGIPEIIDWRFNESYSYTPKGTLFEELDINDYYVYLQGFEELTDEQLKRHQVYSRSEDEIDPFEKWKIFDCLLFETVIDDSTYVLTIGEWFRIDNDYAQKVTTYIEDIEDYTVDLPRCGVGVSEQDYNEAAANYIKEYNCINLDRKNISYNNSQIELCDLLTDNNEMIHVKKWYSSATLSHLFSQGRISGELLSTDNEFRQSSIDKINEIDSEFSSSIRLDDYQASDMTIVYAIIDKDPRELHERLPFFSKLNMMQATKHLRGLGYNIVKAKIVQKTE